MIRTQHPHLSVASRTHAGLSGRSNEDRWAVASYQGASGDPVLFVVISDGIGGHRAGEVAAELTVERVVDEVSKSDGAAPLEIMEAAIHSASEVIAEHSANDADQAGMGSTCACIWVEGDRLFTAHVGDSRIYLARHGKIMRTTVDHTWVQEAIERGMLVAEQAHDHPNAHVLRRHLGAAVLPEVDTRLFLDDEESDEQARRNQGTHLLPGDILLACTDGLTDMLWDDEILRLLTGSDRLRTAAQGLIDRANQHGGRDNITVVLLGVPAPGSHKKVRKDLLHRILQA